jgi:hypothetical protein
MRTWVAVAVISYGGIVVLLVEAFQWARRDSASERAQADDESDTAAGV